MSSSQIKYKLKLLCTRLIIRNALHGNPKVVYKKLKGKLPVSKWHIDSRLNFAREQLPAVFGRKKFNFDGPDVWYHLIQNTTFCKNTNSERDPTSFVPHLQPVVQLKLFFYRKQNELSVISGHAGSYFAAGDCSSAVANPEFGSGD
ncbi:hypothetical protein AVEN_263656-1 [Araneus ventricosus]|uniref:Uncharacterized protein n=1 Tax=Araneus ventricosus TaxID=182803 RepID=A0A4Y2ARH5_ARAVE|nr:hypothetical protein AVEN_263656-1 [Araneus ventricosus]